MTSTARTAPPAPARPPTAAPPAFARPVPRPRPRAKGRLSSANASTYENNALARCDVFKAPEDKSDCIARMGNKATVQGSVDGGGLLRESVRTYTVEP